MGGSVQSLAKRSGSRRRAYAPMAEINVTPFVDVMLVLLIIFMVTAPLMMSNVPVDLPQGPSTPTTDPQKPITVSIDKDQQVWLKSDGEDAMVGLAGLPDALTALGAGKDTVIYVRGDGVVPYSGIMQVMGKIKDAGFSKVGLVTELNTGAPATGGK